MNLFRAASTVSSLTLLSRVTGLVRDQLMAGVFGASAVADAFHVAFRIPNLFRRLFAEGAFSAAFVPMLARAREAEGEQATRTLLDAVATVLLWALVIVSAAGVVAAPLLVWMMGAGLKAFDTATLLTRWMFPYIGFMSMAALCAGVLNTWRRFAVPAATPVLLNLSMIAAAAWGVPAARRLGLEPVLAMAFGVILGGVLQLTVQLAAMRRIGMLPRVGTTPSQIRLAWSHPGVSRVMSLMAPALLGVSVSQLSLLINTQIASHVAVGAVSWIVYADRLLEFPTALLGVALSVTLTPQLAAAEARGDAQRVALLLDWGLRLVLLLALPCAVALMVFGKPLVAVLFHYGHFSATDVGMTVRALLGNGVGLLGVIAVKVLAPAYYARQDMRTPVKIGLLVLATTQLLNLVLVPWMSHAGLTMSIGVAAWLNAGLLFAGLMRRGVLRMNAGWLILLAQAAAASALVGVGLWMASDALDWLQLQSHPALRAAWLAGVIALGSLGYLVALRAFGVDLARVVRGERAQA